MYFYTLWAFSLTFLFRYLFLTQIVTKSTAAAAMMTTQKFENGYL